MPQLAPAAPASGSTTSYLPTQALHLELTDANGNPYAENVGKKHRITVDAYARRYDPAQTHHVAITIPYSEGPRPISVALRTRAEESAVTAPVSHAEFYKGIERADMLEMLPVFDGVEDGLCSGAGIGYFARNAEGVSTEGAIIVPEVLDEEVEEGEGKAEWVKRELLVEAAEVTKKGRIVVEVLHGVDAVEGDGVVEGGKGEFEGGALKVGEVVGTVGEAAGFRVKKVLARVFFHYEVEGRKEWELRKELEAEMERKMEQYRRMLEKQNRAKVKALRKKLAGKHAEDAEGSGACGSDSEDEETNYCGEVDQEDGCYFCGAFNEEEEFDEDDYENAVVCKNCLDELSTGPSGRDTDSDSEFDSDEDEEGTCRGCGLDIGDCVHDKCHWANGRGWGDSHEERAARSAAVSWERDDDWEKVDGNVCGW
ncbi:hypothetical protein BJ508DRAFT_324770 [Ascobolus immersus RN42]|uniref:Uncharacterized protein n=1 Tax=Ascobolus immersus RN42 TaxID=1160509 RepID=A0A3N4IG76_ASCIM|nr:hypothetical protein BJ508DRAFT_324770 [Ascobolus immersus RN42]